MDDHTSVAVWTLVTIGTVRYLVLARCGRDDPRERFDGCTRKNDSGTLRFDWIGRKDVGISCELNQLLLVLCVCAWERERE